MIVNAYRLLSDTIFFNYQVVPFMSKIPQHFCLLNPKNCGGGRILPGAQEIACHFSQDHTMVTKFLDFIKKHPKYKVVKSFFYYLDRCSRNSAETEPRS